MQSIQGKHVMWRIKAFTLLESLITLAVTSFILLSFSGGISRSFAKVEEQLFFLSFEQLYRDTQKLSISTRQMKVLTISNKEISNGSQVLEVPKNIKTVKKMALEFDQKGGNSSLTKIKFQTPEKIVTYQLYIGSGKYKKAESKSLYSP